MSHAQSLVEGNGACLEKEAAGSGGANEDGGGRFDVLRKKVDLCDGRVVRSLGRMYDACEQLIGHVAGVEWRCSRLDIVRKGHRIQPSFNARVRTGLQPHSFYEPTIPDIHLLHSFITVANLSSIELDTSRRAFLCLLGQFRPRDATRVRLQHSSSICTIDLAARHRELGLNELLI